MKWIGLTGGIGTGKSTVAKILRDMGLPVVDADQLARQSTAVGSPGLKRVAAEFGAGVLDSSGELDRSALGAIVFSDPKKREDLEGILHPIIQELRAKARRELEQAGCEMAFYDVPLLFEKNLEDEFDSTVLVYANPEEQVRRVVERDGLSLSDAEARLRAQLPIDEKVKRADFVIFNRGSLSDLKANVVAVVAELAV
jgi:dephospho-CoA kinase